MNFVTQLCGSFMIITKTVIQHNYLTVNTQLRSAGNNTGRKIKNKIQCNFSTIFKMVWSSSNMADLIVQPELCVALSSINKYIVCQLVNKKKKRRDSHCGSFSVKFGKIQQTSLFSLVNFKMNLLLKTTQQRFNTDLLRRKM